MYRKNIKIKVYSLLKKVISYFLRLNYIEIYNNESIYIMESSIPVKNSINKKKMMILWPFIAIGGAEDLILNILKSEIINREFDFVNVCLYEPSDCLGDLSSSFEKVSIAFYKAKNFQDQNTILQKINYLIKLHEIELLFIPNGTSFFYDSVKQIKKEFPSLRIINQVYDHQEGWIKRYATLDVSLIDIHIAPNLLIKNKYIEYGISDANSPLIYHGINIGDFDANEYLFTDIDKLKKSLKIPSDKIIVSFVGRMHSQKRPTDFLAITKHFTDDNRFHFLMVGDGELSDELEIEMNLCHLSNLTKLGFQRPIQNVYLCTDILVITSQYEALPLVLLGALSMGIPAVTTMVGAIPEVIKNDETGVLIHNVGDLNSFIDGIKHIAMNLDSFKENCRKIRPDLLERFSVESMCQQYLNVFKG